MEVGKELIIGPSNKYFVCRKIVPSVLLSSGTTIETMSLGSSNRLSYDPSCYVAEVRKSTDPLQYQVNPFYSSNSGKCYPGVATGYPINLPMTEPKVDAENYLTNRKYKNDRHQPGGMNPEDFHDFSIQYGEQDGLTNCPNDVMNTRYSLLSDPKSQYRSLSTDHLIFTSLPIDAQTYIPVIGDQGVNSRQLAISQYRKIMDNNGACDKAGSNCAPKAQDQWPFTQEEQDDTGSFAKVPS